MKKFDKNNLSLKSCHQILYIIPLLPSLTIVRKNYYIMNTYYELCQKENTPMELKQLMKLGL